MTGISPVGRCVFPAADGRILLPSVFRKLGLLWVIVIVTGIFRTRVTRRTWILPRMQAWVDWCPVLFAGGAWVALGGAHYHCIREPMNASYEIRLSISGWDQKWIYLVVKFVSHPKRVSSRTLLRIAISNTTIPSITTTSTPLVTEPSIPGEPALNTSSKATLLDASRVDSKLAFKPTIGTHDDDGALINCVAISTYCFKHGCVTVPPKIALAISGFSLTAAGDSSNWEHATRARERDPARMAEFLRGGWKTEENQFRELSPEVEADRVRRLADLKKLTEGLDGLRAY
ncbi:unnamed protein product [Rhizoctonia solani]|uniref:Uncharacterized protein n=1 Tax=Rhizoctonia solani TaxID=456999 RepID=A0A8H3B784_9AGAM|nr:unnamed protein product [Rhizoctonia solani]